MGPKVEPVDPIQGELVSMGFDKEYVVRACNLYKKKFHNKPLRLEVLTEIIIRLQQRDESRKQRSQSIDIKIDDEKPAAPVIVHNNNNKEPQHIPLQQSVSQKYNHGNNVHIHHQSINSAERVVITLVMPSSSIGMQTAEIVMRRDQTLLDLKQLASTCLTDFDAFDPSYAFFHDDSGFIFTEFEITMTQALQLMDVDEHEHNNIIVKIGRIVSKYIKLK